MTINAVKVDSKILWTKFIKNRNMDNDVLYENSDILVKTSINGYSWIIMFWEICEDDEEIVWSHSKEKHW
jgi:hypothetical protein